METEEALEVIWAFLPPSKVGFWCEGKKSNSSIPSLSIFVMILGIHELGSSADLVHGPRERCGWWLTTAFVFFLSVLVAQSPVDVYIQGKFKISKSISTCEIVIMQVHLSRRATLCSCLGNVKHRHCEIGAGCYPSLVSMFSWNQSWAGSPCQSKWLKFFYFEYRNGPMQRGSKIEMARTCCHVSR